MALFGLKYNLEIVSFVFMAANVYCMHELWVGGYAPWEANADLVAFVFWFVMACITSYSVCCIVHNTIHVPPFRSEAANDIFFIVLSVLFGGAVTNFVSGHNLSHHRYTQRQQDVWRTYKLRYKSNFLNVMLYSIHVWPGIFAQDAKYVAIQRKLGRPLVNRLDDEQLAVYTAWFLLLLIDAPKTLLYVVTPQLWSTYWIIGINYLQHDGCNPDSKVDFSRTFTDPVLNFFTLNNGYHTIHHLKPGYHWSILPQKHKELIEPTVSKSLIEPNFPLFVLRTMFGPRLDWRGRPVELPPLDEDKPWAMDTTNVYDG